MNPDLHEVLFRRLPQLYEGQTLETLPQHILRFLSALISSDAIAYNEVNLNERWAKMKVNPQELNDSTYFKIFEQFMHEHPLIRHQQETGDMSAMKISDFISRKQFHATALYQEVYRHIGAEDQFAFSLQLSPGAVIAIAMNRSRRNFTEDDRNLLNLLQPHLIQAYRNAQTLTSLQNEIATIRGAFENISSGLVLLNTQLRIQFATDRARTLLQKYFPGADSNQLPDAIRLWLQRSCNWRGRQLPNAIANFSFDGPNGNLTIRRASEKKSGQMALMLEETRVHLSAKPLQALKLTPRQAEVLFWVAQGKSNPEIAIILGTASRTVQKHLEHIFVKLGVESRTAAARRALEVLNSGLGD